MLEGNEIKNKNQKKNKFYCILNEEEGLKKDFLLYPSPFTIYSIDNQYYLNDRYGSLFNRVQIDTKQFVSSLLLSFIFYFFFHSFFFVHNC